MYSSSEMHLSGTENQPERSFSPSPMRNCALVGWFRPSHGTHSTLTELGRRSGVRYSRRYQSRLLVTAGCEAELARVPGRMY